jgi:hypothetical protein
LGNLTNLLKEDRRRKYETDTSAVYKFCDFDSEDDLEGAVCTLHDTVKQFEMKISPLKSKVMAFEGEKF